MKWTRFQIFSFQFYRSAEIKNRITKITRNHASPSDARVLILLSRSDKTIPFFKKISQRALRAPRRVQMKHLLILSASLSLKETRTPKSGRVPKKRELMVGLRATFFLINLLFRSTLPSTGFDNMKFLSSIGTTSSLRELTVQILSTLSALP